MTKLDFLLSLREKMAGLPETEIEDRLRFYCEMIEDWVESGLSEEEAVAAIGSIDEIADQIAAEIPPKVSETAPQKPKRRRSAWEIVLLVLGAPIWLSLLIAAFAVTLSLYISLWSVIISLWAVFGALVGCGFGAVVAGIVLICTGHGLSAVAVIGAGFVCDGLAIFLFYGCKAASGGTVMLTKNLTAAVKNHFTEKETV